MAGSETNQIEEFLEEDPSPQEDNPITDLLEENSIDPESQNFMVIYDKDGPIENAQVSTADTHDGVEEVLGTLKKIPRFVPALVSGWDVDTLERRREQYLNPDYILGGSMGTVIQLYEEKKRVHGQIGKEKIYSLFGNVFEEAAKYGDQKEGLKILPQGNESNLVASIKFEAENSRANVGEIAEDVTTQQIYQAIKDRDTETSFSNVEEDGKQKVEFENTEKDAEVLTEVLTSDFVYPGLRFEERGGDKIAFYRDENDLDQISKAEGEEIMRRATPEDMKCLPYDDWGADLIRQDIDKTSYPFGKPGAVMRLGEEAFNEEEFYGIMIGDSETDIEVAEELDNIVFVAVEGSSSHEIARKKEDWARGRDYEVAEDAVDFTLSLSKAMEEYREDWDHYSTLENQGYVQPAAS